MKKKLILICFVCVLSCRDRISERTIMLPPIEIQEKLVFAGASETAKNIVLISGDEEYRSEEALPQLAKILSERHGFNCTVLFAQDPKFPGIINPNYTTNIPGLDALDSADMMIVFTRFRALPDDQMQYIDNYLKKGKPVLGIRTATHAFNYSKDSITNYAHYGNYYQGDKSEWTDGFGRLVLGENWVNHHGHHKHQSTRGIIDNDSKSHPITNGIRSGTIWGPTDVYGIRLPLPEGSQPIILGQVIDRKGAFDENDIFFGMRASDDRLATINHKGEKVNNTLMPIAWTKPYQLPEGEEGKAFISTIGAATDLLNESTRRLLVNSIFWAMNTTVPEKANVTLVGDYSPSAYGFQTNEYWIQKKMKIGSQGE